MCLEGEILFMGFLKESERFKICWEDEADEGWEKEEEAVGLVWWRF